MIRDKDHTIGDKLVHLFRCELLVHVICMPRLRGHTMSLVRRLGQQGAWTAALLTSTASRRQRRRSRTLGHVSPKIPAAESGTGGFHCRQQLLTVLEAWSWTVAGCCRGPNSLCGLWSLRIGRMHASSSTDHCLTAFLVSSAGCYARVNCDHAKAEPKYKAYLSV
jgi:hypothetical protein